MCKHNKILEVKNLGFKYQNSNYIFKEINFKIKSGEILCLLGPNGSGKTTLLNCIAGFNKQNDGDIYINDTSTSKMSNKKISYNIGYVPQTITASFDYKVIDYVVCGVAPYLKMFRRPGKKEYDKAWESLKTMEITHLAEKSYTQISGGEQQQVCIARVLTQAPDFILLDEPTSHLDFGNVVRTLKIIKQMSKKGFGLIMTTHNPDHTLMMGGKTLIMKNCGNYIFGNTENIVTEESLRNLYGVKLYLEKSHNVHRNTIVAESI